MKNVAMACALVLCATHAATAQSPDAAARSIVLSAGFKAAVAHLATDHDRFVRELIHLPEIPAPPLQE